MYRKFFKRLIDFFVAVLMFVLLSPLFVVITIILLIVNKGRPFFSQLRPGKHHRVFRILKFKSMNDKRDAEGNLLADSERLTGIGKIIRKTSMDEIPQLLNVMAGDMSLVGPRPLLLDYLAIYNDHQKRRHEVRPGITGWAQVNGRNAMNWKEKFELDLWYVDHVGFLLDCKILIRTIKNVIGFKGINYEGHSTMPNFTGNSTE